jgi:dihydrofolate reductase
LYTATSLDGFIARPDGNIDWLTSVPNPDQGDYGYSDLLAGIETIIMGRKTYDDVLGFGIPWPYAGFKTYIVTTHKDFKPSTEDTFVLSTNWKEAVLDLKHENTKDIWLMGGGQLNTAFINEGLLDQMIITIVPKMIGEGIRLFAQYPAELEWTLVNVQSFNTGLVNLTYDKKVT